MADAGKSGGEDEEDKLLHDSPKPPSGGVSSFGGRRHLPRGIVIQLTGTEGEWDSLEDQDEDFPSPSLCRDRQISVEDDSRLHSQTFPPSSQSSLEDCPPTSSTGFLSPGPSSPSHRPFSNLVKSLSTELEPKDGSTLRPKPFLNLVKSISTELSRSEPEVSQSKSDSRLNLHLWKQLTEPKARSCGDSRTAPPSPSGEPLRAGFFKMELEDTRRKFSEAVHEPLSCMFSKIMREDGAGSPKHQSRTSGFQQGGSGRPTQEGSADLESPVKISRKTDADVFDWPSVRNHRRLHHSWCPMSQHRGLHKDEDLDSPSDGPVMEGLTTPPSGSQVSSSPPLPHMTLFCVGLLSYGYFVLPLTPYCSGLALGLGLGFLLGLILIRMGSCSTQRPDTTSRPERMMLREVILNDGSGSSDAEILKGWMNQVQDYDPETFQSSQTQSVFATLDGSCLRLDSPRTTVGRRAMYHERVPEPTFVKTRCFHLERSKVFLVPSTLARKRTWNPKYPICIQLTSALQVQDFEETGSAEQDPDALQTPPEPEPPAALYLLAQTGREKEEWFRHFLLASAAQEEPEGAGRPQWGPDRCASRWGDPGPAQNPSAAGPVQSPRACSRIGSSEEEGASGSPPPQTPGSRNPALLDYHSYMDRLLPPEETPPCSPVGGSTSSDTSPTIAATCSCDLTPAAWADALIGRIFWDFLREKHWTDGVSQKIQKKLSKIRLPHFMNELTVTGLDMGSSMPHITAASCPAVNHRGVWVELQVLYTGGLQMTLQTGFNLSKLGKEESQEAESEAQSPRSSRSVLNVLEDSDEESSSADSSEDEEQLLSDPQLSAGDKTHSPTTDGTSGGRTGRRILRFMDRITRSRCFQKATESEFVRRKLEEVSSTPLLLSLELQLLQGSLLINIPPPPSDRIWYSFSVPPRLELQVKPKLGDREVSLCHVTDWIQKKLQNEFQKVFVFPNMDDVHLPMMHSGLTEGLHRHGDSTPPENRTETGSETDPGAERE